MYINLHYSYSFEIEHKKAPENEIVHERAFTVTCS